MDEWGHIPLCGGGALKKLKFAHTSQNLPFPQKYLHNITALQPSKWDETFYSAYFTII
jgi:hypothetical protein